MPPQSTLPGKGWFQSTHPHGVRLSVSLNRIWSCSFQSTHPHGVRPLTPWICDMCTLFQSTHPHGVRQIGELRDPLTRRGFNPRTRTGCDDDKKGKPWQGMTGFNPRTRTGCDHVCGNFSYIWMLFQSTHPHGVRLTSLQPIKQTNEFQSTHPHGVRLRRSINSWSSLIVSIHAPARGATKERSSG